MENNKINEINYKQWVSTLRVTLDTTIKSRIDFVADFCEKLSALLPHNFIAKKQAAYLRDLKETLKEHEFIVIVDFAENYAFVVQDAAPGFHWNNDQGTVYTVVIYYKINNELTHESMEFFGIFYNGKGPCDGKGETVKIMAVRASLQLPPHLQILTPIQLFEWSSQNLTNINIRFSKIVFQL